MAARRRSGAQRGGMSESEHVFVKGLFKSGVCPLEGVASPGQEGIKEEGLNCCRNLIQRTRAYKSQWAFY